MPSQALWTCLASPSDEAPRRQGDVVISGYSAPSSEPTTQMWNEILLEEFCWKNIQEYKQMKYVRV